ncbi:MAG TPA: TonB family protein [Polyangiaceae bacterium]|nr:TonB family protein [Polyangiaceae bacterium]
MPERLKYKCACCLCAACLGAFLYPRSSLAAGIEPPRIREQTAPRLPGHLSSARNASVELSITVTADGAVRDPEVVGSPGEEYSQAALDAVKTWVFEPARRGGRSVAARVRVLVPFLAPAPSTTEDPKANASGVHSEQARAPAVSSSDFTRSDNTTAAEASPSNGGERASDAAPAVEVLVRGRAEPPSRGASDYRVRVGELSRVPRKNSSELLKLAPGVFLTNEGGEGHAERIYLRGFDAREGQDIEFSVGGVPVNESGNLHGNGFADLHFVIPELVHSLRVVEGPFDPRQGNYAVAGSADYELGLDQRGLTLKYAQGTFGTKRALVTFGPPGESAHTFGGAELYETRGFGRNRDARRATAMGQYEGSLGDNGTFRLSGAAYANTYHAAGLVREDDFVAGRLGFFDTYDPRQGGSGSRFQLAFDVETKSAGILFHQQVFAVARSMRLRENFTGFLLDTQEALQSPHAQRGDLLDLDMSEGMLGARGFARARSKAFGRTHDLELGYFARGDVAEASRQRIEAASGAPYKTDVALRSKLADIGLYADVAFHPWAWLSLRGGFRADFFAFDVLDACAVQDVSLPSPSKPAVDESCFDQQRGGEHREPNQRSSTGSSKIMPRVTVIAGPFNHVTFSGSLGTGVRSIDPSYITDDVATPFASIEAVEGGVSYSRSFDALSVAARSVFFTTHVDRDLVFSETEGRAVLGAGTRRTGWAGTLRLTNAFLDESANVTLLRSSFDDTGLLVPYTPDLVFRSDTALGSELPFSILQSALRGSLGVGMSYVGRRALPYGQRSETMFLVDGAASLRFRGAELSVTVMNLFDSRYRLAEYEYVSAFRSNASPTLVPTRHFAAGAPRGVYFSLSLNLGGG